MPVVGLSSALTCEEIVERRQRHRLNVERVASLSDVVSSEQWRIREMVQSRCDPDGSIHYGLGPVFRIESAEYLACRRAPAVGADSDDVRAELEVGDGQSEENRARS